MQEGQGGGNEPQEVGAWTAHSDAEDGSGQADPGEAPAPADPGEAPTLVPGSSWVPGAQGGPREDAGPPSPTVGPGQDQAAAAGAGSPSGGYGQDQAGYGQRAGGPWTPPPGQATPPPGQAPNPWATPQGQGQSATPGSSPWATPPGQGQAGTPGPWATPYGQSQAGASGPWSILPPAGSPGGEGYPGGQQGSWAGPAGGYGQPGGQGPWGPPPPAPPGGYGGGGAYGEPPRKRRSSRLLIYALVAVLAAGAGAVAAALAVPGSPGTASGVSAQQIPSPSTNSPGNTNASTINVQAVAGKVEPGVVDIVSKLRYTGQVFEGTGMILSSSGLVLTNNHVVAGTTHLTATLVTSGRKYTATVLGTDATDDVALIKLQGASGLKTIQVGNSAKVTLGTPVVAIGNAGGRGGLPTVTSGTITSLHRTITASDAGSNTSETLHNMLQTNAPIAEGDSGGPLSDATGQVIGMDTAANTQTIGGPGTDQGFAIPIDRALSIARQIAAGHGNGNIRIGLPAFIGVAVAGLPSGSSGTPQAQLRQLQKQASQYGGGINSSNGCLSSESASPVPSSIAPASSGTLIAGVFCGDPAAGAGIKAGDVITSVGGHTVTAPSSLTKIMSQYRPGDTVRVTWVGLSGQHHTTSLTLTSGPAK